MAQQLPSTTPLFIKPRAEKPNKRGLSKEEIDEVRFAFETLDAENSGTVTQKQIKVALRAMGFPVKKGDVYELLRRHGDEEQERLDWQAFLRVVSDKLSERSPTEDMQRAFQLLDNGLGGIDMIGLRKVTRSLGLEISEQELHEMVAEFDLDGDGKINEREFMSIVSATED